MLTILKLRFAFCITDEPTSMSLTWPNGSTIATEDTESNLTCTTGISMPPATFRWFRNNVDITNTSFNPAVEVNSEGEFI